MLWAILFFYAFQLQQLRKETTHNWTPKNFESSLDCDAKCLKNEKKTGNCYAIKKNKKNLIIYLTILFLLLLFLILFLLLFLTSNGKQKNKIIALFLVRLCPDFIFSKYKKSLRKWKKNSKASRTWRNACLIYFLCFSILILNKKEGKKK